MVKKHRTKGEKLKALAKVVVSIGVRLTSHQPQAAEPDDDNDDEDEDEDDEEEEDELPPGITSSP